MTRIPYRARLASDGYIGGLIALFHPPLARGEGTINKEKT